MLHYRDCEDFVVDSNHYCVQPEHEERFVMGRVYGIWLELYTRSHLPPAEGE